MTNSREQAHVFKQLKSDEKNKAFVKFEEKLNKTEGQFPCISSKKGDQRSRIMKLSYVKGMDCTNDSRIHVVGSTTSRTHRKCH